MSRLLNFVYIFFRSKNRHCSFAYLLPIVVLLFWAVILVIPGVLFFTRLKQLAHGSGSVSWGSGGVVFTIPSDRFFEDALDRVEWWAGKPLMIVNTPGKFADTFISLVLVRMGIPPWPQSMGQSTWHALIYPFYALPAWIYVGFAVDAVMGRRHIRNWNLILSFILVLTCASLFCGFQFGTPVAERSLETSWFIDGLAIWAVLFSIPVAAWLRQKKRRTWNEEPLPS